MTQVIDSHQLTLGDGPLWHPKRAQLFWFDIFNRKLLTQEDGALKEWSFDEKVSAAGWIDDHNLLIASEDKLISFALDTGATKDVCPLSFVYPDIGCVICCANELDACVI